MTNYLRAQMLQQIDIPHITLFYEFCGKKEFRISYLSTAGGMSWAFHEIDGIGRAGSGFYSADPDGMIAYAENRIEQFEGGRLAAFILQRAKGDEPTGWIAELHRDPSVTHGQEIEQIFDRFDA